MAARVDQDSPGLPWLFLWDARAQVDAALLGLVQVVDSEVEVELLRAALVGPRR